MVSGAVLTAWESPGRLPLQGSCPFMYGAKCQELSGFLDHWDLILWLGLSTLCHDTSPCVCLGWQVRQGAQGTSCQHHVRDLGYGD